MSKKSIEQTLKEIPKWTQSPKFEDTAVDGTYKNIEIFQKSINLNFRIKFPAWKCPLSGLWVKRNIKTSGSFVKDLQMRFTESKDLKSPNTFACFFFFFFCSRLIEAVLSQSGHESWKELERVVEVIKLFLFARLCEIIFLASQRYYVHGADKYTQDSVSV